MLFDIKNLHVSVGGKEILKGFNLTVNEGEIHAIMGPNGTGKSTLAAAITGREGYEITEGEIWFKGKNILEMSPSDRANEGIFLSFQYPVEIPVLASRISCVLPSMRNVNIKDFQTSPCRNFLR